MYKSQTMNNPMSHVTLFGSLHASNAGYRSLTNDGFVKVGRLANHLTIVDRNTTTTTI